MFLAVRPLFRRLVASPAGTKPTQGVFTIALIAMLASALVTEAIGVHAIFGAFLLGAVIPNDSALARSLRQSGELVIVLQSGIRVPVSRARRASVMRELRVR